MNIPPEVETWRQAWVAEDTDLVLASATPDVVYSDPYGVFEGHDALEKYCAAAFVNFVDWEMDVLTLIREGDRMAVEWQFALTSAQPESQGRRATFTGVGIVSIRDGRISEWRDNFDSGVLLRQLKDPSR